MVIENNIRDPELARRYEYMRTKLCRRPFFYIMISCVTFVILHYAGYNRTQRHRAVTDIDKKCNNAVTSGRCTSQVEGMSEPNINVTKNIIVKLTSPHAGTPDSVVRSIDEEQYVNSMPCEAVMKDYNISKYNYIMAMSCREQLTMATDSFSALVNLARGLQSRVVTPFTHNSELYGLPSTDDFPSIVGMTPSINQGPTKPLNIIYDMKQLNSDLFCDKYRLPPLAPFNEFIRSANRRIIVIHTNVDSKSKLFPHGGRYMNCGQNDAILNFTSKLLQHLNAEAEKLKSLPFQFDSACCIPTNNNMIESPLEIAEGCGFSPPSTNISIIFTVWLGYYSEKKHTSTRLVVADTPIFKAPSSQTDIFPLSQGIINNASAFANDLSCSDNVVEFVAVHIRTGKIQAMGGGKGMFEACFNETLVLLNDLRKSCSPQQNCIERCLRYFVDYGEFGSHSYRIIGGQKISKESFKRNNIKPVHYDPRQYGGIQDTGFVASVEQLTIAAHSSILILVGHGGFQNQLLAKFKEIGHGTKAYRVCLGNWDIRAHQVYNRDDTTLLQHV